MRVKITFYNLILQPSKPSKEKYTLNLIKFAAATAFFIQKYHI